ncbi:glutathione S-transferase [Erythrobacter sp. SG61-1L]|uniref:glutathione S-transferase family protein n=1 Tax=Erythrobacter sp. SG61-1L TaxID=1603897 RepID=UPI0006C8FB66|nr:glutathione S-transferase family protein [Erythrobacter sp. SG61-1L]KPL68826.1 glutathione S-transferase [Erythrobacter sp. SG61-1L]
MSSAILYHGEPNGPSLSVLAALEESGLAIECRPIDLLKGERHALPGITESVALDFAVEGEGPVLVIGGEAMTEAVFLAQYLDEQAGGCGLQPEDAYAHWQMMMWCRQVTERLSPAVAWLGALAYAQADLAARDDSEFAALSAAIVSDDLRQRWQDLRSGVAEEAKSEDSRAKIAQFAQRAAEQLADGRDWLMGSFSIADLETYAWLAPAALLEPEAFSGKPQLAAWMDRVRTRPSVRRALARTQSGDPFRSFAPGPEINRWG